MKSIRSAVTCSPGTRYAPETDTLWLALSIMQLFLVPQLPQR